MEPAAIFIIIYVGPGGLAPSRVSQFYSVIRLYVWSLHAFCYLCGFPLADPVFSHVTRSDGDTDLSP